MKWISHKVLTGSLVYAVSGDPFMGWVAAIGSILPDAIEGFPTESNYNAWRARHRQLSHWFVPYFVVFFLSYAYAAYHGFLHVTFKNVTMLLHNPKTTMIMVSMIIAFLMLGAFLHIVEDAICGKVPGVTLTDKIGIKLFSVGSFKEYLFVSLGVVSLWLQVMLQ